MRENPLYVEPYMNIRNFCIIAHIDHGKSTLADRLIEMTGTVEKRVMKAQLLDMMDLERERGITIKLQPVRMIYNGIQLNLIDTPGHTDFRYEVSRSLAAVEGAVLLVDASQGIQAQTLAVLMMALEHDLTIIPVINKIDLPAADPQKVSEEVVKLLGCKKEDIINISAKEGTYVEEVLQAVLERIPEPSSQSFKEKKDARALIFDAILDPYRGAIAYVRSVEGIFSKGMKVHLLGTKRYCEVQEVGHFSPSLSSDLKLFAGEIGYIVTGLKDVHDVRVGDTISSAMDRDPLPGYKTVQPMVFAGLYPSDPDDVAMLREGLETLQMNDASLTVEPQRSSALGNGFRCGFLGLLHMEIIQERLEREEDCDLVVTAPSVMYEILLQSGETVYISNPAEWPDPSVIRDIREPWINLEILCRKSDIGSSMDLVQKRRGRNTAFEYLRSETAMLTFEVPLSGIVTDFFDNLKSATEGYGSMSYEQLGFRSGDLVKLQILLLGEPAEALSIIVHRSEAESVGRAICSRLKDVMPKEQFAVPIQAAVGSRVLARETLPALRKDVTGYLYGGDVSRKKKLLKKQKKGKKRMKEFGKVKLTQEAFLSVLKR
jgi:GTP-binding protein LepA